MNVKEHFIANSLKLLPKKKQGEVLEMINNSSEDKINLLSGVSLKKPFVWALIYWLVPFGWLFDRLLIGQYLTGVIKLFIAFIIFAILLAGGGNYGAYFILISVLILLIEGITLKYRVKSVNFKKVKKVLQ